MYKIGIVGAGVMGRGIAQCCTEYGHKVLLEDIDEKKVLAAISYIKKSLQVKRMMNPNQAMEDIEIITDRIKVCSYLNDFMEADIVIECITEDLLLKKKIYEILDSIVKEDGILLSNTSCISITKLASFTKRPDKVIGTHFMNPVPNLNVIEVIKGYHTSLDTIRKTQDFLESIHKEAKLVNDYAGFVSNRISHLMMNEAAFLLQDGVADAVTIDDIFEKCYGHKMGPLKTADLIGLDTVVYSLKVLYDTYQDSKFRCCPLLRKMVDAGLLGQKSGKGFYNYE